MILLTAKDKIDISGAALQWAASTAGAKFWSVTVNEAEEYFLVCIRNGIAPSYPLLINMRFTSVQEALDYFAPPKQLELF